MSAKQFFLNRRQFFQRVAEGTFAFGLMLLARCGLGGDDVSDRQFITSTESSHYHTVTITSAMQMAPPSAGAEVDTTEVQDHTHQLDLTAAQLTAIGAHQSFTATTSNVNGHEHTVTFN